MNPKDVERAIEAMKNRPDQTKLPNVGDIVLDTDSDCYYLVIKISPNDDYGYLDLVDGRVMNIRYDSIEELRKNNQSDVVIDTIFK